MLERAPKPKRESAKPDAAPKPAVARDFQPPAIALEEDEPARVHWWALFALTAFLIVATLWASLAHVDRIVVARGELVTVVPSLVVQPLERVAVTAVHVKVGDVVRKGQLLASLDPTFTQADVDQLQSKLSSLTARQQRLEAEMAQAAYVLSSPPNRSEQLEFSVFTERRRTYEAHLRGYAEELAKTESSLATARADLEKADSRLGLLQQIVTMREALFAKAYDSQLRLFEAQAQLTAAEREKLQDQGKIDELGHQAGSINAQRDAYVQEWREKAADELVTVLRDREAAVGDLNKALRRRDMVSLVAPENAIVLEIGQRSTGSVLREAEILVTLVPLDAPLAADARLSPLDVGLAKVGDEVRLKLDAFPFQRHGTARGVVETISADAFRPRNETTAADAQQKPETAPPFHKARVKLVDTNLRNLPNYARLLPGMTVTAEIKVGERRVISYLLWPIMKGLDEGLREP